MSRLKMIDAESLEKILVKLGFERKRQKGSHITYRHPDGRVTTVHKHKGQDIKRTTLRKILREINLSIDEYNSLN